MTNNVYRTAQGKMVDMGSITLQNEMIRAVGNMNVNARGDRVDGTNQVIDSRARQVQRQVQRQSNMSSAPVHSSTVSAKQARNLEPDPVNVSEIPAEEIVDNLDVSPVNITPVTPAPVDVAVDPSAAPTGLAAALAKAKTVKQTLDPTLKQQAQAQGIRKL